MNQLTPFNFETRTVRIVDRNGQPWFVASDVCASLEISQYRDAIARLDEDERASVLVDTLGGMQSVAAVNESGVYKLAFKSRKAGAKRFVKWLTSEVLPSIRRTGHYGKPAAPIDLTDRVQLHALLQQLTSMALEADSTIAQLAPKAEALDRLANADGLLCITDAAKALDVPPRRLFAWMEAHKWIYRRANSTPHVAYEDKRNAGLLKHKCTIIEKHGYPIKHINQVMVTRKGLVKLSKITSYYV